MGRIVHATSLRRGVGFGNHRNVLCVLAFQPRGVQKRHEQLARLFFYMASLHSRCRAVRFAIPVTNPRMVKPIRYRSSDHQVQWIGKNFK